jgi:hypothetical protein
MGSGDDKLNLDDTAASAAAQQQQMVPFDPYNWDFEPWRVPEAAAPHLVLGFLQGEDLFNKLIIEPEPVLKFVEAVQAREKIQCPNE